MSYTASIVSILAAILLAAAVPGPSFLMIAQTSASQSLRVGFIAALGMGVGGTLLASFSVMGLQTLFERMPLLYQALRLCGGLYLFYTGIRLWMKAKKDRCIPQEKIKTN